MVGTQALLAALALLAIATPAPVEAKPVAIIVTTLADVLVPVGGGCSLRGAITASNTNTITGGCKAGTSDPDPDSITFAVGTGIPTIDIGSDLPTIVNPVKIRGVGQAVRVRLHGPGSGAGLTLASTAQESEISGLVIENFGNGVMNAAAAIVIKGNVIGPNTTDGVLSTGTNVTIGGTAGVTAGGGCTGDCNVIDGNGHAGILMNGSGSIQGNVIGLAADGSSVVGNGLGVLATSPAITIGGVTAGAGNVISGNASEGLRLDFCSSCVVQGNRIGTNAAATAARPNGGSGLFVRASDTVTVGGVSGGNVIAGNGAHGIYIEDSEFAAIRGSWIGTTPAGVAMGNGGDGIHLGLGGDGASRNLIGSPGTGNTIAHNGGAGVLISSSGVYPSVWNTIRGNAILENGANGGIYLGTFANQGITRPVITDLRPVRGTATCTDFCTVDVYSDNEDEGRVYEGSAAVDGSGHWQLPGLFAGPKLTATVTDLHGNTSAFASPYVPTTPFTDIGGSPFAGEITWLYANGITSGCTATTFCPGDSVTRDQMASFLVREFAFPATATDAFSDDNGNLHEADINALAAAGVTTGCSAGHFCPKALVLRDQMASFLARSAGLTVGGGRDYFRDDDGDPHEANIDRNAAAGITAGCGAYAYCPTGTVTRAQMAAYLRRILVPLGPPPYPAP